MPLVHADLAALLVASRQRVAQLEAEELVASGHDPLTGLVDLRAFCQRLEVEISRARRHARPLAVALLDVDGFTEINGRHGVDTGDGALRTVAGVLERHLRAYDLACRTWGDEFALLLPETDPIGAQKCLERVLLELGVVDCGPIAGLGASTGVASFTGRETAMQLFSIAGRALDAARGLQAPPAEDRGEDRDAEPEAA